MKLLTLNSKLWKEHFYDLHAKQNRDNIRKSTKKNIQKSIYYDIYHHL